MTSHERGGSHDERSARIGSSGHGRQLGDGRGRTRLQSRDGGFDGVRPPVGEEAREHPGEAAGPGMDIGRAAHRVEQPRLEPSHDFGEGNHPTGQLVLRDQEEATGRGGAEAYALSLRDELRAAGDDVRLLTSSAGTAGDGTADYVAYGTENAAAQTLLQIVNPFAVSTVRRAFQLPAGW